MSTSKYNKPNKEGAKSKALQNTKSMISDNKPSFVFINFNIEREPDKNALESIKKHSSTTGYFITKNEPGAIYNSQALKVNKENLTLNEVVIFIDMDQPNSLLEISQWQKLEKKLSIGNPIQLYDTKNNEKSDSIAVPRKQTSLLFTELSNHTNANELLSYRLMSFKISSTIIPLQEEFLSTRKSGSAVIEKVKQKILDYFSTPILLTKSLTKGTQLQFEHPMFKSVFSLLLLFSLVYLIIGSQNIGINSDEYRYIDQAKKVINFYKTMGADSSACKPTGIDAMHYNIQIVDNVLYALGKLVGWEENFRFRHFMVAIICWFSIFFTSMIAHKLGGYRLAVITTLLMICSPIFIGNGFNNERDMISVLGIVLAMHGLLSLHYYFPIPKTKYLINIFLGILFIGGQRVAGGVLTLFFMGLLFLAILYYRNNLNLASFKEKAIQRWVLFIVCTCIGAYGFTILIWPFGLLNPISHVIEALKFSNKVSVGLNQVFEGKFQLSTNMPPHYLIKYLLITLPFGLWLGFLFTVLFYRRVKINKLFLNCLSFVFIFSIGYAYFKLSTMYGSWRQFTLIFPFMALFSAVGWNTLSEVMPKLKNNLLILGILIIALAHPIQYAIRNHPFEYIYYNEFIGGTGNAYGKYEWDYAFNSLKQGSDWLKKYIRQNHPKGTKLVIASNGNREFSKYFDGFDDSITIAYTRYYERGNSNWDYAIFPNVYIHPYQLRNNVFSRLDSLHFIKVDGKPICFIYKRNNRNDYNAVQALTRGDINTSVSELNAFLKHNPKSEWAWFQLAYIYGQQNNFNQCQIYLNEAFKWHPEFLPAKALQGLVFQNTNRCKDAIPIFQKLLDVKYDLANTYKWSAMCYETEKNYRKALEQYGFALGAGNKQKDTYAKIANCLRQLGDNAQANKYEQMSK